MLSFWAAENELKSGNPMKKKNLLPSEALKNFGEYLKTAREAKGLSQAELASRLGYTSPQFVSNVERGIVLLPLEAIRKAIRILDLNREKVIDLIIDHTKARVAKGMKIRGFLS